MTEDIRLIECYHLNKTGDYVGEIPILMTNRRDVQLQYRFDNKWWLIIELFDEDIKQWKYETYGPLNDPIKTYYTFQDKIISINTLDKNPEVIQEFLQNYLMYNAKQMAKIAKKI